MIRKMILLGILLTLTLLISTPCLSGAVQNNTLQLTEEKTIMSNLNSIVSLLNKLKRKIMETNIAYKFNDNDPTLFVFPLIFHSFLSLFQMVSLLFLIQTCLLEIL